MKKMTDEQKAKVKNVLIAGFCAPVIGGGIWLAKNGFGKDILETCRNKKVLEATIKKGLNFELADNLHDAIDKEGYYDVVSDFAKSFASRGFDLDELMAETENIIQNANM